MTSASSTWKPKWIESIGLALGLLAEQRHIHVAIGEKDVGMAIAGRAGDLLHLEYLAIELGEVLRIMQTIARCLIFAIFHSLCFYGRIPTSYGIDIHRGRSDSICEPTCEP